MGKVSKLTSETRFISENHVLRASWESAKTETVFPGICMMISEGALPADTTDSLKSTTQSGDCWGCLRYVRIGPSS